MNDFEKGFIIGMIEGEGCINISIARNKHARFGFTLNTVFEIANNNKLLLEKCNEILKIDRGVHPKKPQKPTHHIPYGLRTNRHEEIIRVLEPIYKDLISKRKQAEWLLEFCKSRQNVKENTPYSRRELEIGMNISVLNARFELSPTMDVKSKWKELMSKAHLLEAEDV